MAEYFNDINMAEYFEKLIHRLDNKELRISDKKTHKCNKLLWSFQEVVIDNVKKLVIKKYDSYMILNNLNSIYKVIDKKDFNQQVYYDRVKKLTNYVNEKFKDDNFLKKV